MNSGSGVLMVLVLVAVLVLVLVLPFYITDMRRRTRLHEAEVEKGKSIWESIKAMPFAYYWLARCRRKADFSRRELPEAMAQLPDILSAMYSAIRVDDYVVDNGVYQRSFTGAEGVEALRTIGRLTHVQAVSMFNRLLSLGVIAPSHLRARDKDAVKTGNSDWRRTTVAAQPAARTTSTKLTRRRSSIAPTSNSSSGHTAVEMDQYFRWVKPCFSAAVVKEMLLSRMARLSMVPHQLSLFSRIPVPPEAANMHYVVTGSVEADLSRATIFTPVPEKERLSIFFKDLNVLYGRKRGKRSKGLQHATGLFKAGEITGVLGPSGAGKSTLLNMLHGTLGTAEVSGELYVGDRRVPSVQAYRSEIAVMPQEPTLQEVLTVHEQLFYAIMLLDPHLETSGLRAAHNDSEIESRVVETARLLGLGPQLHNLTSELSGGQRKRLSLAMCLIRRPKMLLLDEPTSGLDPSSALIVARVLSIACSLGVTVMVIVHQPRIEVYHALTNVMLMVHGGRIVFQGPGWALTDYLSRIGYSIPAKANPSDAALDIVHGIHPRRGQKQLSSMEETQEFLVEEWGYQAEGVMAAQIRDWAALTDGHGTPEAGRLVSRSRQFLWASERALLEMMRTIHITMAELVVSVLALSLLLTIFRPASLLLDGRIVDQAALLSLFAGLTATLRGALFAGRYVHIVKAEERSGLPTVVQFLALSLVTLPISMLFGMVYGFAYFAITSTHLLWAGVGTLVMTEFAVRALAELSVFSLPDLGLVLAALATIITWAFKGVAPSEQDLDSAFGSTLGGIVVTLSPIHYTAKGVLLAEFRDMTNATYQRGLVASVGYTIPESWRTSAQYDQVFWALLVFFLVFKLGTVFYFFWTANNYEHWGRIVGFFRHCRNGHSIEDERLDPDNFMFGVSAPDDMPQVERLSSFEHSAFGFRGMTIGDVTSAITQQANRSF